MKSERKKLGALNSIQKNTTDYKNSHSNQSSAYNSVNKNYKSEIKVTPKE